MIPKGPAACLGLGPPCAEASLGQRGLQLGLGFNVQTPFHGNTLLKPLIFKDEMYY